MKINKQSNIYTIIYITVMVLIVGAGLAVTATALRPRQQANADADKMAQILASVRINPEKKDIIKTFDNLIIGQYFADFEGNYEEGDAFAADVKTSIKVKPENRELPLYLCRLADGSEKWIIPLYGAGLWGPIWGYVSLDTNGSTIYGAYFAHQGETPGLGAEIEKPEFSNQFRNLNVLKNNQLLPIMVEKKGQTPTNGADYVDAISGGTITSKGVESMLQNCLAPYQAFLLKIKNSNQPSDK